MLKKYIEKFNIKEIKNDIFKWFAFIVVAINSFGFVCYYLPAKIADYLSCSLSRFLEIYGWSLGLFCIFMLSVYILVELYRTLFKEKTPSI